MSKNTTESASTVEAPPAPVEELSPIQFTFRAALEAAEKVKNGDEPYALVELSIGRLLNATVEDYASTVEGWNASISLVATGRAKASQLDSADKKTLKAWAESESAKKLRNRIFEVNKRLGMEFRAVSFDDRSMSLSFSRKVAKTRI